jgi:hypothetical protein
MLTVPDDDELVGRVDSGAGDLATGIGAFCSRICSLDERGAGIETCTKPAYNSISTHATNDSIEQNALRRLLLLHSVSCSGC